MDTELNYRLRASVAADAEGIVSDRRLLHAQPELSFEEYRTTEVLQERMRAAGAEEAKCPTPTGGVFVIEGGRPGRTVLLRADIDALPVGEEVDISFRSKVDGCMHACGHDAHTAMLVGAARALGAAAPSVPGRYVFLFQPGEERLSGARAMLDGGLLEAVPVDVVIGCHVMSVTSAGMIVVRGGLVMSDGQSFRVTITGAGGHGAMTGMRGNPLAMAARLILELPTVVDGMVTDGTACACSAGMLHSGTASNIIASEATIEGTLRTFTDDQKTAALGRFDALVNHLADDHDVRFSVEFPLHAPAVVNDGGLGRRARRNGARPTRRPSSPRPSWAHDTQRRCERDPQSRPRRVFFLGAALSDNRSGMHHSPRFAIDDNVLPDGSLVLAATAAHLAS